MSRARLRKVLLSVEIALTVVLLVTAGLLLKSFLQLRTSDLGVAGDHVITMGYSLPKEQYSKPEQNVAFAQSLLERVKRIPGVESAGLGAGVPGSGWVGDQVFIIPERPHYEDNKQPDAMVRYADPTYFATLGIPLISGRAFNEHDNLDQSNKVIVTQELVKRYYPGQNVLGRTVVMGTDITNKKRTLRDYWRGWRHVVSRRRTDKGDDVLSRVYERSWSEADSGGADIGRSVELRGRYPKGDR